MRKKAAELTKVMQIPNVQIRTLSIFSLNYIRNLKNQNSNMFFHKKHIGILQQFFWFMKYSRRREDNIYVLLFEGRRIGCIGIRKIGLSWDFYNIIRNKKKIPAESGLMSLFLQTLIYDLLAHGSSRIQVEVLKSNPALDWYLGNGFVIESNFGESVIMRLLQDKIGKHHGEGTNR